MCTGNICRSPAAERLLVNKCGGTVDVSSAGTAALEGQPIAPLMRELLVAEGAEVDQFAARALRPVQIKQADLVLGLTRAHRAAVVQLVPAAVRRTFALREFARVLGSSSFSVPRSETFSGRLAASIPIAAAHRVALAQPDQGDDDVLDPYGGTTEDYALSFRQLAEAVSTIAALLEAEPSDEVCDPRRHRERTH
ncbi:MAG TPA: hypothetical protein VEQ66_11950 [Propionibacteriaceae bacterium]|nr:hypothetical protein [Propionibacteriaceae bacterium]